MWLLHGTTLNRAKNIIQFGPDLGFIEPGGLNRAENFSFTCEGVPSAVGDASDYARGKAAAFPDEGGPVILAVDVSTDCVRLALEEHLSLFKGLIEYDATSNGDELVLMCGGVVQFDNGPALRNLMSKWADHTKVIRGVA